MDLYPTRPEESELIPLPLDPQSTLIDRADQATEIWDCLCTELRGLPPWLRRAILAHGYRPILGEILTTKESK
jgi:hypothetical protein